MHRRDASSDAAGRAAVSDGGPHLPGRAEGDRGQGQSGESVVDAVMDLSASAAMEFG